MRLDSKLLIDEPPLQVIPSLAKALTVNPAIMLQQIHYWCRQNRRNGIKEGNYAKFIDGRWWMYNTFEEWVDEMPWLSLSGVRKCAQLLRDAGYVITAKHGGGRDHTLWYTIDYDALAELELEEALEVSRSNKSPKPLRARADLLESDTSRAHARTDVSVNDTSLQRTDNSPRDSASASPEEKDQQPSQETPAKDMTTKTVDRTREVGFEANGRQIGGWGKGWKAYLVPKSGDPPDPIEANKVLAKIVSAAAGELSATGGFYLPVSAALEKVRAPKASTNGQPARGEPEWARLRDIRPLDEDEEVPYGV